MREVGYAGMIGDGCKMALVNYELIQELRDAAEAYLKEEVLRVTGREPIGAGDDLFTEDNIAIVTGTPRPTALQSDKVPA